MGQAGIAPERRWVSSFGRVSVVVGEMAPADPAQQVVRSNVPVAW
jgi:hypothetical protein